MITLGAAGSQFLDSNTASTTTPSFYFLTSAELPLSKQKRHLNNPQISTGTIKNVPWKPP